MVDPDLLRNLLLALGRLQRSPPEAILLSFEEMARQFGCPEEGISEAMGILDDVALIEGPGPYASGWLFRQLSGRGRAMVEEMRQPRRWAEIKRRYGAGGPF